MAIPTYARETVAYVHMETHEGKDASHSITSGPRELEVT